LAVVITLEKRKALGGNASQHHNMPLSAFGAAIVWAGW
jgi:ammonia channel protein AmtB